MPAQRTHPLPRISRPRYRRAVPTLLGMAILSAIPSASRAGVPTESIPVGAWWTQDSAEPPLLQLGRSVTRTLKAGESHTYRVALEADQLVSVIADQRGVDLALTLAGPGGLPVADLDNVLGASGRETLTVIATTAGEYRLEVHSEDKRAAGRYNLTLVARRPPRADELRLEDARRLSEDARGRRQKGRYDEAIPLAERALAIAEGVFGSEHPTVADALHLLALLCDDTHDYGRAAPLNERALAIREKALGPDHPDVARSLFNLAWLAKVRQDFSAAELLYRRTLSIQERALGAEHTEVATTLNDLALLYGERGDLDQAVRIDRRVLAIREKALGADDVGVAVAHNNLALAHEERADYPEAVSHFARALQIWEQALGPEHPDLSYALDGLAKVRYYLGDYAAAEPLYLRALAIREKAFGSDDPEVATTLNNLATLYRQKGDYAKAESLLLRDLAITEKRVGPDHGTVAPTLINLASIYRSQGAFDRADGLYRRALSIRERALGPTHPDVASALNHLGQLHAESPNGEAEARSFLARALSIMERTLGPEHHRIAAPLATLGVLAARGGDYTAAEFAQERALTIQEKALGPDHPDVALSLERLSEIARARGDLRDAVHLLQRAHETRERHLVRNLPPGSERQKLAYLKLFAQDVDRALSLHARMPSDPEALELAFTTLLRRKGRALDATIDNVGALRVHARPQDQELFDRLLEARSHLAALTLRGPGATDAAAFPSRLRRLEDELDRLEAEVGARSAGFRAQSVPVTVAAVRAQVPEDAALVEFAWYRPTAGAGATPEPRYSAYLLAPRGEPQWVDLGEAAVIEGAVAAWRGALRDPERPDVLKLGRALDARILEPVLARLGPVRHVLVSPDGELNLVPFAALVDQQGHYRVERLTLTSLTSGRDLLRLQVRYESRNPPVILATPAFGEPSLAARKGGSRPRLDDSQVFFGPLPGAAREVRELRKFLPTATVLAGTDATEAALRRVAGPRLLHVATHGFFLGDEERRGDRGSSATRADGTRLGKRVLWVENPLLRSGLALAGANQGPRPGGDDDGVLTALEAAGLDLWGTRLVVLSACDTGLGEVKRGDGVYGLRRALVLAGAESQLISLWPVSDRGTRQLMIAYYEFLARGEARGEALRRAQMRLVGNPQRAHPYYWASFIQSGQWEKLDGGLAAER